MDEAEKQVVNKGDKLSSGIMYTLVVIIVMGIGALSYENLVCAPKQAESRKTVNAGWAAAKDLMDKGWSNKLDVAIGLMASANNSFAIELERLDAAYHVTFAKLTADHVAELVKLIAEGNKAISGNQTRYYRLGVFAGKIITYHYAKQGIWEISDQDLINKAAAFWKGKPWRIGDER